LFLIARSGCKQLHGAIEDKHFREAMILPRLMVFNAAPAIHISFRGSVTSNRTAAKNVFLLLLRLGL
jgi:hypothetical protein